MSADDQNRYRLLLAALLRARVADGGHLSQDDESARIEELDLCWRKMTRREQDDVEAELALLTAQPTPRVRLTIDNLVQALDGAPGGPGRYHGVHVFADDLVEAVERTPSDGVRRLSTEPSTWTVKRGNAGFSLTVWPHTGVVGLYRSPWVDPMNGDDTLDGSARRAVSAALTLKGQTSCPILGLLVGSRIADSQHIFPLEFDTRAGSWHVYDGGLMGWMKEHLLPKEPA